jgi:tetratricopeptide (TPR) repeat protein
VGRRRSRPRGRRTPANVRAQLAHATPARLRAATERQLAEAAAAYERDRYQEALTILRSLPPDASSIDAVRELRGLTFYRLGRWKEALRELRGFAELTGSVDQHPVIADSERALGHHDRVADIWTEIRRSGASSDVVAEGRLVMAGSLADRGKLKEAIAILGPASLGKVTKPRERHVRQWYMLGDLYERTGDVPRAREMFQRVVAADAATSDAVERLSALSAPKRRGAPRHHR